LDARAGKIAESKDIPTIQSLDPAVPPIRKARPKTLQNMLVAGMVALILGILMAFSLNHIEQLKVQEER